MCKRVLEVEMLKLDMLIGENSDEQCLSNETRSLVGFVLNIKLFYKAHEFYSVYIFDFSKRNQVVERIGENALTYFLLPCLYGKELDCFKTQIYT